ncbi:hypothetical protein H632_c5207p0, partial [Helicosporidium sp. ATCC 50920]
MTLDGLSEAVRHMVGEILGPGALDAEGCWLPGAFDSLSTVELGTTLVKRLGVRLPATVVYDYPSCGALVDHVAGLLGLDGDGEEQETGRGEVGRLTDSDESGSDGRSESRSCDSDSS